MNSNQSTNTDSSNVDTNEIAKFDALASRWWDQNGEFKALHDINPLRLGFIESIISLRGKKCLDVGCGGGIVSEGLAHRGASVVAIDMAESPLEVARLHLLESKLEIDYKKSSAESFAQDNAEQFDIVTCLEMLEHVPDPASVVQSCAALVKPGGHLFFSTINRNPKSYAFSILGGEYLLNLIPRGTHDYEKFIKPSELAAWSRQSRLETLSLKGMSYNPISQKYHLGSDVDVNYLVAMQKPEAFDA